MAARKNTLKDLLITGSTKIEDVQMTEFNPADTPPHSDSSYSPEHSLPSSPEYPMEIKHDSDDESIGINRGMLDHSKMGMCMFMLAVIAFNPFGIALHKMTGRDESYSATGRTLLSSKLLILAITLCESIVIHF